MGVAGRVPVDCSTCLAGQEGAWVGADRVDGRLEEGQLYGWMDQREAVWAEG